MWRHAAAALLAILAIGAVSGCGGSSARATAGTPPTSTGEVTGVGQVKAGSVASLAQCSDWNEGDAEARLATIADIREQVNQAGADGPTPDLSDAAATALFDRACANDFAIGFRLYKLYLRAASFGALAP